MGEEIHIRGLNEVLAGLTQYESKFDAAVAYATAQVGFAAQREAQALLKLRSRSRVMRGGKIVGTKVKDGAGNWKKAEGHIGGPGTPPNLITGQLMNSVRAEISSPWGGTYVARVFPTAPYARALELGNPRWKSKVKYPYMAPALETVRPKAETIFFSMLKRKLRG